MKLSKIPEKVFEFAGTVVGFGASVFIALQIQAELTATTPSTMSLLYTIGFLFNFLFWFLYGLRFKRLAVWLVNIVAVIFQFCLLIIIILK